MSGGQQMLDGMPRRLYPCTPTRLSTWLDCPRRYRWAYLDRPAPPKGPPWAHNSVGAAVHSALADWWALPAPARSPRAGVALVQQRWLTEGFRDGEQSAEARRTASAWVEEYLARVDPFAEPLGVERTVSTPTSTLVLSGRVDRIDERLHDPSRPADGEPGDGEPGDGEPDDGEPDDGEPDDGEPEDRGPASDREPVREAVVVDYKTGRWVPDAQTARTSLALAVYAVATQRTLRRPCFRVELHHLPSESVAQARHTPESLRRKVAEAESIAADAARADAAYRSGDTGDAAFPPRPSALCSWCDWRAHCPQGQAAARPVEPWSGLAALDTVG